jgi:hypothetical protein
VTPEPRPPSAVPPFPVPPFPVPPFPFVVGCDRSGTTLVRAILNAHPALAVPSESYFPLYVLRQRSRFERAGGPIDVDTLLDDLRPHPRWQNWNIPEAEVRATLAEDEPRTAPDAVRSLFRAYAAHAGKSRYGDKTPKFVFAIDLLADAFPEAVFVHVVRDGRDVALSRRDAGWALKNMGSEALRWKTHVESGDASGATLGPARYRVLRYEDLVVDPETQAKLLCDFLGLPWDPAMLRYHERAEELVSSVGHPELHQNLARPPTAGLRDWRTALSPADLTAYDAIARDTLARFGYPRGATRIGVVDRARAWIVRRRWEFTHAEQKLRGEDPKP